MALIVIKRFAASEKPLDINRTIKAVTAGKIRPERSGYFPRKVKRKVFKKLNTNDINWRSWPRNARRFLGAPETHSEAKPVILRMQEKLPL